MEIKRRKSRWVVVTRRFKELIASVIFDASFVHHRATLKSEIA